MSLNDVENDKIREGFKDPRIHFAINCAAKSCPPIRTEPYVGAELSHQLDDQARKFLNGPQGARMSPGTAARSWSTPPRSWTGSRPTSRSGAAAGSPSSCATSTPTARRSRAAGSQIDLKFDDYDWKLNDASK